MGIVTGGFYDLDSHVDDRRVFLSAAATTYQLVAQSLTAGNLVVPVCHGRCDHPVGFGRDFYRELVELHGDSGARRLLEKYVDQLIELPLLDAAIHSDIDVPDDLAGMR